MNRKKELEKIFRCIYKDCSYGNEITPHKNVYFIKPINAGDRKNLFISFRIKLKDGETYIFHFDINLDKTEKNLVMGITNLQVKERKSKTIFRKSASIANADIEAIITKTIIPTFIEKCLKIEGTLNG